MDSSSRRRKAFTTDVIRALAQKAEQAQTSSASAAAQSQQQAALTARHALQYDFPIVAAAEVNALADLLTHCLELKGGSGLGPLTRFLCTAKLVDNIVQGAKQHTSTTTLHPPPSTHTSATPLSSKPSAPAQASTAQHSTAATAVGDGSAAGNLQAAYQRLCTCMLLRLSSAALRVSEEEAWQLLGGYEVEGCEERNACNGEQAEQQSDSDQDSQQQQQQQQRHETTHDTGVLHTTSDAEAPESDPDDFEFEPLEPLQVVQNTHSPPAPPYASLSHSTHPQQGVSAPFDSFPHSTHPQHLNQQQPSQPQQLWPALLKRLCALVCPGHLEALLPAGGTGQAAASAAKRSSAGQNGSSNGHQSKDEGSTGAAQNGGTAAAAEQQRSEAVPDLDAWRLSDTGAALLQLLRSVGVHAHAADLHSLLQACVTLLGRRLCAHPEEMSTGLQELWDTLGVCGVASMPPALQGYHHGHVSTSNGTSKSKRGLVLAPEASTALTLIVDLANSHVSSHGRAALWRHVNLHTLPVLRRCLEDVATARTVDSATLEAVTLVAQVVLFYLQHAPGGFSAPKALLSAGVVRGLAVAFPKFGPLQSAEELRCVLLLCAAGSAEVCAWVSAVPSVFPTLTSPPFQLGGWAEAHGVLWQLLLLHLSQKEAHSSQRQVSSSQPQKECSSREEQLALALLQGGRGCVVKLRRMSIMLELLLKAWHQAGRRRLWGATVDAALRESLAELKRALAAKEGVARGSESVDNGTARGEGVQGHCQSGEDLVDERAQGQESNAAGSDEEGLEKVHGSDAHALEARSFQRVAAQCVKVLKELLMSGGKMD